MLLRPIVQQSTCFCFLFIFYLSKELFQGKEEERKPFNFDEFCHEIDSHPIFMKELKRDEKGEFSPEIQALQVFKHGQK